jgi:hypothetical protein
VGSCGKPSSPEFTLYRNSSVDASMRIHFASFDAADKGAGPDVGKFNQGNCKLAADLLNANVAKLNAGAHPARFWCEKGAYRP